MIARALAVATLVALALVGCTSTVVLGTVPSDGGETFDFSQPRDLFDGGGFIDLASNVDGFDFGFGSDAALLVDLAQ